MAKLNVSTLFETSKALATDAGKQLGDFITWNADAARQIISALRNNLTFRDNFNCVVRNVSLSDGVDQPINTDGRQPSGIIPVRVVSSSISLDSFGWYINDANETVARATFTPAPSGTIPVILVILF